jgi:hypothetical protein
VLDAATLGLLYWFCFPVGTLTKASGLQVKEFLDEIEFDVERS